VVYKVKLLKKEVVADDTMAFHLEKPVNFDFIAGQNADFTLINPSETDEEGDKRTFSFVNAPYEKNLVISTRMRDTAFKRNLKKLAISTEVKLDGPYGDFKLHKNEAIPAVFIIGGIGITPVHSIISEATHNKLARNITLFYSNRTPDDAAFINDLEDFEKNNPNFTFVPVFTKISIQKNEGERGHINENIINKYVSDLSLPIYYLSGPSSMVKVMRQVLIDIGIDEDNIRTEQFSGY